MSPSCVSDGAGIGKASLVERRCASIDDASPALGERGRRNGGDRREHTGCSPTSSDRGSVNNPGSPPLDQHPLVSYAEALK